MGHVGGWRLRWCATASRAVYGQVVDERHGRCALVSTRGPGDGAEVLTACRPVGRWRPALPFSSLDSQGLVPDAEQPSGLSVVLKSPR